MWYSGYFPHNSFTSQINHLHLNLLKVSFWKTRTNKTIAQQFEWEYKTNIFKSTEDKKEGIETVSQELNLYAKEKADLEKWLEVTE